ncbi:MAG: DNA polymerase II [Crenarchaeota archaeon]|nr:DNA polymerase II [Thermoproteota archaeon]
MGCGLPSEIDFMLLDSSYEVVGREPIVLLWGIDGEGRRVILLDRRFRPYFYVLPRSGDLERVAQRVRGLSKPRSPILRVDVVDKKYFGKPCKALKVVTLLPEAVREYREEAKRIGDVEVLEADIRFAMRYLIDKLMYPFHWYRVKVEEVTGAAGFRVDKVYRVVEDPVELGERKLPELKILAFDIEVYNKYGTPRPQRDPVIIISLRNSDGEEKLLTANDHDDRGVIREFINYVKSYDPDIIIGYNSNKFDWPYLLARAHYLGMRLDVTRRVGAEPTTSVYGHVSVAGRLNVDLYDYAEEMHEIKVKTLEEVAEYLGVMRKDERVLIPWWEIPSYWDDKERKRKLLLQYALDDVRSTYGIGEKILPFAIQLSYVTGIPLDQVGAMSVGFRLEWYLMRAAYTMNELVPNRVERREESYRGAIVLEPLRGIHENIAVLDFSSMYPNIMIKYNVGPDTLVRPGEPYNPDEVYVAPEVGHKFRKHPPGFFKQVLVRLLELRKRIKAEMKKYPPDTPEYRVLDERQKAVKVLANATYGYMGWTAARWYCRECAEAVTAWGRNLIRTVIEYARKLGLKVIYGDTDSLFVTYIPDKVKKLIDFVENELGFEIKIDKIYKRVFFTEAKKRYAGLLADGRIDIVGFEAVRGDWCELAKEVQAKVAEIVLKTGDIEKAIKYVREVVKQLKECKIPIEKLIIWKTITKKLEEYSVEAPHIAAAKRMIQKGFKVSVGDKIGYVIVKGTGRLSQRAYPYFMVKKEDIDVNYYIDHQLIPAVMRILGYFGVSEKRIKAGAEGQRSLFDFFAKKR